MDSAPAAVSAPHEILSALGAGGMGEATARAATRRILELINELKAEGLL